jgi:hypothetical protein
MIAIMRRNYMPKENKPLLSEEYLDGVVREINQLYSGSTKEQNEVLGNNDIE